MRALLPDLVDLLLGWAFDENFPDAAKWGLGMSATPLSAHNGLCMHAFIHSFDVTLPHSAHLVLTAVARKLSAFFMRTVSLEL